MKSNKDPRVYFEDILESIGKIEAYVGGKTYADFEADAKGQDAVVRRLEIIGEAVKNIPDEIKAAEPGIPWRQIAGMRDVIVHEYAVVSLERVWKVVTDDLGQLKSAVERILPGA
jgi:uncharacterized protein with HEPN domain